MAAIKVHGYGGIEGDVTPTVASDATSEASLSEFSSPESSQACFEHEPLTKEEVLTLQRDLMQELSSPAFQKGLRQASGLRAAGKHTEYQKARLAVVRDVQRAIVAKHGFPPSDKGVDQMLLAIQDFHDDPDVSVNETILQQLSSCGVPAAKEATLLGFEKKTLGKRDMIRLLKSLQEQLAPCFGFEKSKEGVLKMISTCGTFLTHPEVSELFDVVNAKLGMSPAACKAFRTKVQP
ncbi:unnamed protein product [Symbiodinium natans]|uniref:Protein C10 n=1 Tax=Symbiodinium natans TaxID=878477 RepID=A0A812Q0N2_9DINO|nr:unnamed protein product [Symbiodinium natans]